MRLDTDVYFAEDPYPILKGHSSAATRWWCSTTSRARAAGVRAAAPYYPYWDRHLRLA